MIVVCTDTAIVNSQNLGHGYKVGAAAVPKNTMSHNLFLIHIVSANNIWGTGDPVGSTWKVCIHQQKNQGIYHTVRLRCGQCEHVANPTNASHMASESSITPVKLA